MINSPAPLIGGLLGLLFGATLVNAINGHGSFFVPLVLTALWVAGFVAIDRSYR